jgi:hypothetical protein
MRAIIKLYDAKDSKTRKPDIKRKRALKYLIILEPNYL